MTLANHRRQNQVDARPLAAAARQSDPPYGRLLIAGSVPFLVPLASLLLASGLPALRLLPSRETAADGRFSAWLDEARIRYPETELSAGEAAFEPLEWQAEIRRWEAVVYIGEPDRVAELLRLREACRMEGKPLLPVLYTAHAVMIGPLDAYLAQDGWPSAWRRLHADAIFAQAPSAPGGEGEAGEAEEVEAVTANAIAHAMFARVPSSGAEWEGHADFYLLHRGSMTGAWHRYAPHPLESASAMASIPLDLALLDAEDGRTAPADFFTHLERITSPVTGLLHEWDEGELKQLPVSLCRARAADPIGAGPAVLLPPCVCGGLTHEEARREAGLAGLEAYAARLLEDWSLHGVGVGASRSEAVCRALQAALDAGWRRAGGDPPVVRRLAHAKLADERCDFYRQALDIACGETALGRGEAYFGFPVLWVRAEGTWYGAVGLHPTLALRQALLAALLDRQCGSDKAGSFEGRWTVDLEASDANPPTQALFPPLEAEQEARQLLAEAAERLQGAGVRLEVSEYGGEPALQPPYLHLVGVNLYGRTAPSASASRAEALNKGGAQHG
ncbi:hypothetical protein [Cohnella sp. REN36]|uniref:hypothetical protein n=1 Tax=Cohnella sp. REN36 TaxID=2887347 RepID=UPI001D154C61|nr:hypothetical protein [Cohnella sp. REN36]MCC3371566.1 hypothetical protein [Cohnella sp. REN36]